MLALDLPETHFDEGLRQTIVKLRMAHDPSQEPTGNGSGPAPDRHGLDDAVGAHQVPGLSIRRWIGALPIEGAFRQRRRRGWRPWRRPVFW